MDGVEQTTASTSDTSTTAIRERLFRHISSRPNVFYASQQKDDPELTDERKREILAELLEQKPAAFLERYHKLIPQGLIAFIRLQKPFYYSEYIDIFPPTDRCAPYIKLIRARPSTSDRRRIVRNRRFVALQRLKNEGFFSLEQMRERAPFLFDEMITPHLGESGII